VAAIRSYGGEVRFFGNDGLDTELHAREYAEQEGMKYLSPYNDAVVIAGQGTCGIEIAKQLPEVAVAFIAVGGGGLISGIASVLKTRNPNVRIIGCQPEASAVMAKSVAAGHILDLPSSPTLSDGTAGGIEAGSITFELCRDLVDEFMLVSEAQIVAAVRDYMDAQHQLIEGAAGVAIAAMLADTKLEKGAKTVVVICGANISRESLKCII
jgi:threonine dehydratase